MNVHIKLIVIAGRTHFVTCWPMSTRDIEEMQNIDFRYRRHLRQSSQKVRESRLLEDEAFYQNYALTKLDKL